MIENKEILVLETDNLLGVAEALKRSKAQSVVTAHISGPCGYQGAIELAEAMLESFHGLLCPDHPRLRGYIFFTPKADEEGFIRCDKLSISFDHLDQDEAADFMMSLPSDLFRPNEGECGLKTCWNSLDADRTAQKLAELYWGGQLSDEMSLETAVVMHPYVGTKIMSKFDGWFAVHLGARPAFPWFRFHDPA